MKTPSHTSSKHSALILGTVLTASTLFAGITLAQSTLTIPTNLSNAIISIQKIVLSPSGTDTANPSITLDGQNGNIDLGGDLTLTQYPCNAGSGCMLKVDTAGKVIISQSGASDDGVFKRTVGGSTAKRNNIYLALEDGEATIAGKTDTTQSYLRVGVSDKSHIENTDPEKDDTAMVVGGVIESRGGLFIKKVNANAELSNSTNNRKVRVNEDYTSLDLNTTEGKVNFISNNKDAGTNDLPTSFIFSADRASTRLGINNLNPTQALDVSGSVNINSNSAYRYNNVPVMQAQTPLNNYFFGNAGNMTMRGVSNTAIGNNSLRVNANGSSNTANGTNALASNTQGSWNTANGNNALSANTIGNNNTANGRMSLAANTIGINNTAQGHMSLGTNTIGNNNTAIGRFALAYISNGNNNTAIGMWAGVSTQNGTLRNASNSIFLGDDAKSKDNNQSNEIVIGSTAVGNGSNSVTLGNNAITKTVLKGNVGIKNTAPAHALDISGSVNINSNSAYKYNNVNIIQAQTDLGNYFFGNAGNMTMRGIGNIANGSETLKSNTLGNWNTAIGENALMNNIIGSHNVAIGDSALKFSTAGRNNTAIGAGAGVSNGGGDNLEDAENSVFLGADASSQNNGQSNEIVIGASAIGNGSDSVTLGNDAISKTILRGNVGIKNTAPAHALDISGSVNINSNSAYKYNNINVIQAQTALNNYFFGNAGNMTMVGTWNTANGSSALRVNTLGNFNTANGSNALAANTVGSWNTANGSNALAANTIGNNNTANGRLSLATNTIGNNNTAIGHTSLGVNTNGNNNTAIGRFALAYVSNGSNNTALGRFAGIATQNGTLMNANSSIFLGDDSKAQADNQSNEIVIGASAVGNGSNSVTLGNDAITKTVLKGNVGIGINPTTDRLSVNGNAQFAGSTRADAYYYNSDRRYKSDIEVLTSPLANLLKISGYSYYSKLEKKDTIGVIAQEVEAVYPELVQTDSAGYKSVQYGNLIAPIIEAIRELSTKIDNLFTLYVSQQAKIDTLEARLLKLESQVK